PLPLLADGMPRPDDRFLVTALAAIDFEQRARIEAEALGIVLQVTLDENGRAQRVEAVVLEGLQGLRLDAQLFGDLQQRQLSRFACVAKNPPYAALFRLLPNRGCGIIVAHRVRTVVAERARPIPGTRCAASQRRFRPPRCPRAGARC